jgi:hypothetical protein
VYGRRYPAQTDNRGEGATCQRVIDILAGRIAVDLDCDALARRGREYRVPVGDDASA